MTQIYSIHSKQYELLENGSRRFIDEITHIGSFESLGHLRSFAVTSGASELQSRNMYDNYEADVTIEEDPKYKLSIKFETLPEFKMILILIDK